MIAGFVPRRQALFVIRFSIVLTVFGIALSVSMRYRHRKSECFTAETTQIINDYQGISLIVPSAKRKVLFSQVCVILSIGGVSQHAPERGVWMGDVDRGHGCGQGSVDNPLLDTTGCGQYPTKMFSCAQYVYNSAFSCAIVLTSNAFEHSFE